MLERLRHVAAGIGNASPLAMFIAAATLITIVIVQKIDRRWPAYLIALAVGAGLGQATGASGAGIAMFEPLAGLVPQPVVPSVSLDQISALLPGAASIAFIGLLEAISIGRAFALRRREPYDANQEIIGQGLSNSLGGFLQAYAGSGSFTRSALNVESGARSPLSAILSAGFLFVLLFLLAPFIDRIPVPAMAGIILYVGWRLISFTEIRHIVSHSRSEAVILLVTFLAGVTTELENSIFAGIIASLSVFLYRSARPHVAVMAPVLFRGRRQFRGVLYYNLEQCPQISVLRIEGPLFFASVEHVERELRRFETLFPGQRYRILQLKGLGRIDLSAATFLADEIERTRRAGGDFHIVAAHVGLVRTLEHTGVCDILGRGNLHPTKTEAIAAAMLQIDDDICAGCEIRTYLECAGKPVPVGNPSQRTPREIETLYSDRDLA